MNSYANVCRVGGGLDAVIAMTGHKDIKLADHYSKLETEYQKEVSQKIMKEISFRVQGIKNQVMCYHLK